MDGLWVLQVLSGIEVVAPELGLRPHFPRAEPRDLALNHPVTAELRDQGVVDGSGKVDATVADWLTVASRRDIAVLVDVRSPDDVSATRALLARFASWWVVLRRSSDLIGIHPAGTAAAEGPAAAMIGVEIERLCGPSKPARLRPVTLDLSAFRCAATTSAELARFLATGGLDGYQEQMLTVAADGRRSAQASIVPLQGGVNTGRPTRTHIGTSTVTIIDTPNGRLVTEHVSSAQKAWMVVDAGTTSNIASALNNMLRRLPAREDWFSYRKAL
jgi:hypothetical protein